MTRAHLHSVKRRLYRPLGSLVPSLPDPLVDFRDAKSRDHMFSDRRQTAADADLETGGIRLIEQLQHGLIDLDGALLELVGIGFGRDKRCDVRFTRHRDLLARNDFIRHRASFAGAQLWLIAIAAEARMSISRGGKAPRGFVVGRLFDAFDKEMVG